MRQLAVAVALAGCGSVDKLPIDAPPELADAAIDAPLVAEAASVGRVMPSGCPGVLVDQRTVLTAARCLGANLMFVSGGQTTVVVASAAHPTADLATINLAMPVDAPVLPIERTGAPRIDDEGLLIGFADGKHRVETVRVGGVEPETVSLIGPCFDGVLVIAGTVTGFAGGDCSGVPRTSSNRVFISNGIAFPFADVPAFVRQQHTDILETTPTAATVTQKATQINDGLAPAAFVTALLRDPGLAGNGALIVRVYIAALGRLPDVSGYLFWTNRLRGGTPSTTVADEFANLNEFKTRHDPLTNTQFIDRAHMDALGRAPTATEKSTWETRLTQTYTRGDLFFTLLVDATAISRHAADVDLNLTMLSLLRRSPSGAERTEWATDVAGGKTLEALVDEVLATVEYTSRMF